MGSRSVGDNGKTLLRLLARLCPVALLQRECDLQLECEVHADDGGFAAPLRRSSTSILFDLQFTLCQSVLKEYVGCLSIRGSEDKSRCFLHRKTVFGYEAILLGMKTSNCANRENRGTGVSE